MQALLEHFVAQSVYYSLIAVALVAFLESLALVGLVLPGTVMMACLGAMIGNGKINFWQAWIAGSIGCLLGDWISFLLGWRFKNLLYRFSFMKKNKALLDKTEHALHQHSTFTILVGRFIGPTRPLVPMVAGMLDLSPAKFIAPNIIGCLFWPPLYFLPGILAGLFIDLTANKISNHFNWLLLLLLIWFCWRSLLHSDKIATSRNCLKSYLPRGRLFWLLLLILSIAAVAAIYHPLILVYSKTLLKLSISNIFFSLE